MSDVKKIFQIIKRENYDTEVKMSGCKIQAYTMDMLEELYPDDDFKIIGEAKKKTKKDINALIGGYDPENIEDTLKVVEVNTFAKLFYKRAGYVLVDKTTNEYIALVKFRFLFIILFVALVGLILGLSIGFSLNGGEARPTSNSGVDDVVESTTTEEATGEVTAPVEIFPEDDPNILPVNPEDEIPTDENGNSVGLIYTTEATVNLATNASEIYFINPPDSKQHLVLELYVMNGDEAVRIGASGLIRAGNGLTYLEFENNAILHQGKYSGKYKVYAYDAVTAEKAIIEVEIPMEIMVVE